MKAEVQKHGVGRFGFFQSLCPWLAGSHFVSVPLCTRNPRVTQGVRIPSSLKYTSQIRQESTLKNGLPMWPSLVVKNSPANAGDTGDAGSIPGLGRTPIVGNGNSLQYFCLENSTDTGSWGVTVHGVTKSWT